MGKIPLNADWSEVLRRYKDDHQDPRNQFCHQIGIPLIVGSFPVGATLIGLPLAAGMFTVGWGFQFVGHAFEGKKPSFVDDRRSLLIGVLWCLEKYGMKVFEEVPPATA
ncbi:Mpo1-like protein [Chondromyces apiculatus]|uniref:DUF962 domain-containing protein n=1 Tax=Chondromyces apiculatus DSM 436 TaxID=1192034 RepID=A0A017T906_9BACT|nr:DUF962 domain-containing protein [Chondromyces apiculatus]EYF05724.1 Hypothetical protein CAP_3014 [Chondromyces apiculatus DSM 436]